MNIFMMRGDALYGQEKLTASRFERFTRGKWPFVLLGAYTVAIPNDAAIADGLMGVVHFAEDAMYAFMQRNYRFNITVMDDGCAMLVTTCGIYSAEDCKKLGLAPGQQPGKAAIQQILTNMVDDIDDDDIIAVVNMPN